MIRSALMLLLVSNTTAQDEFGLVEDPHGDVDATPWIQALTNRFLACLEVEGTSFDGADAAVIEEAVSVMAPALAAAGGSSCTDSAAAVASCTSAVTIQSCESLHDELAAVLAGDISLVEVPGWAAAYASAMSGAVSRCYEAETGVPLAAEEQADLALFENMIGQAMGALTQACGVREENVDTCTAEAGVMDCAALAAYLASDEVDLMVRDFMAGCEGAFDCGY